MPAIVTQLITVAADWHHRRKSIRILSQLSDATLRDIGIFRADIVRIVDTGIAAQREALNAQDLCRQKPPQLRVLHKTS